MRAPVQKKRPRSNNGTRSQAPGDPLSTGGTTGPTAVPVPTPPGPSAVPANTAPAAAPTGVPTAAAPTGVPTAAPAPAPVPAKKGRPKRVRNRLVAGVALVGVTVLAAGAPAVLTASGELTDSQSLVTLAELDRQAVTLAHSLADERDEVVAYIAAGRDEQQADGDKKRQVTSVRSTRVDRQIDEIRPAAPAELRRDLSGVPSIRRTALTGEGTALEAHKAYTDVIAKLQALADELAEQTPPRAAQDTRAPASLGHAVEQASATRGLLLAALAVPQPESSGVTYDPITGTYVPAKAEGADEADRTRNALTAAAQQARVRELAALADFDQAASSTGRDSLAATVSGPDVKNAERLLARLADQPELSKSERKTDPEKLEAALSARVEQMRGVESALAATRVERLADLRDDDVTALEVRIAFLGGCLLIAIGISTYVARSLTRPLAVLRIGAARLAAAPEPEAEEPVRFTGRNDEFAQVVRSLNTLQGKLADLGRRTAQLDSEHADLTGAREALTSELAAQRAELQGHTALLTAELERLRHSVHHTFVNLSLRGLGLVERQLGVIEKLEEREQDPERLATLFKLDHMATVMRRHSENLLVLAGHEHVHGHPGPVPLVDVLRAAVSEIERYERVAIQSLPPHAQIAGFAADDLSHLIAELLENATSFSPPDTQVQLSGWLLESGEVMLSVQDEGIGMTESRLTELNARLAEADPADVAGEGLGIRVAALLAARHGVRVQLREQKQGGIAAVVVLPLPLLPTAPPTAGPPAVPVAGAAPTLNLPGSVAEANSNALPSRTRDPLVEAAERAIKAAGEETKPAEERSEAAGAAPEQQAPAAEPAVPAEGMADVAAEAAEPAVAETTLQVRLPDPPQEPDAHERASEETGEGVQRVTDKGLPKRTPKIVQQPGTSPAPRKGGVDAEALRRRLGGFHQGAKEGRRDVEAEIGSGTGTSTEAGTSTDSTKGRTRAETSTEAGTRAETSTEDRTRAETSTKDRTRAETSTEAGTRAETSTDSTKAQTGAETRAETTARAEAEAGTENAAVDTARTEEKTGDTVEEARS